jgi:glucose-fructose oxidoreductase
MHMGALLRKAKDHPDVELVGVSDLQSDRVMPVLKQIGLDDSLFFADYKKLMEQTQPDMVILCPATAEHADWT